MKTHNFFNHVYIKPNAVLTARVIGPVGTKMQDIQSGCDTTRHTTIDNLAEIRVSLEGTVEAEEIFGWN